MYGHCSNNEAGVNSIPETVLGLVWKLNQVLRSENDPKNITEKKARTVRAQIWLNKMSSENEPKTWDHLPIHSDPPLPRFWKVHDCCLSMYGFTTWPRLAATSSGASWSRVHLQHQQTRKNKSQTTRQAHTRPSI